MGKNGFQRLRVTAPKTVAFTTNTRLHELRTSQATPNRKAFTSLHAGHGKQSDTPHQPLRPLHPPFRDSTGSPPEAVLYCRTAKRLAETAVAYSL